MSTRKSKREPRKNRWTNGARTIPYLTGPNRMRVMWLHRPVVLILGIGRKCLGLNAEVLSSISSKPSQERWLRSLRAALQKLIPFLRLSRGRTLPAVSPVKSEPLDPKCSSMRRSGQSLGRSRKNRRKSRSKGSPDPLTSLPNQVPLYQPPQEPQ